MSAPIGVDLMGSDHPPHEILQALFDFSLQNKLSHPLFCFGTESLYSSFLTLQQRFSPLMHSFTYVVAPEIITMEDSPLTAIRKKKNSSLCLGMNYLKEGKIKALISAGNTGALVASAKHYLSFLPKVLRPAFLTFMPTKKGGMVILDVGANISSTSKQLIQFAQMGALYQTLRKGIKNPRVGLLNIGTEALKGTSEIQKAYQHLQKKKYPFTFCGNIEGKEAFEGNIDVLVTSGFTGNIFLKTAEGIANLILDRIREQNTESANFSLFEDLYKHLHYSEYPGALLMGCKGMVIKCHGYSTPKAFLKALREVSRMVQEGFQKKLEKHLI